MKATLGLLFLLAFLPGQAHSQVTEQEVIDEIKEGVEAWKDAASKRRRLERLRSNPEAWYEEFQEIRRQELIAFMSFRNAMRRATELTGAAPAGLAFGESLPAKQGPLAEISSLNRPAKDITWEPEVAPDLSQDIFIEFEGADGKPHYAAASKEDLQASAGVTLSNGKVLITMKTLETVIDDNSLAELAYALSHEASHVEDKLSMPEDSKEEGEVRAYERDIANYAKYGFADPARFEASRASWQAKVDAQNTRSVYPGPVAELDMKRRHKDQQAELTRIREQEQNLERSVEVNWAVRKAEEFASRACAGEEIGDGDPSLNMAFHDPKYFGPALRSKTDPGKDGFTVCYPALLHDILRALATNGFATHDYINAWARHRRDQSSTNALNKAAELCGFDFLRAEAGGIIGMDESRAQGYEWFRYRHTQPGDSEDYRAAMLLANACLFATKYRHVIQQPGFTPICNSPAFDIFDKRRGSVRFQRFIEGFGADQTSDQNTCMRRILSRLDSPVTEYGFRAAFTHANKLYEQDLKDRADNKRRAKEAEDKARKIEERNREIEEKARRRRDRQAPAPTEPPDCLPDPTDPRNVKGCRVKG